MNEKEFAKKVTRMFDKKSVLRNINDIVSDGYILYRGELVKDIFYRLRLEATDQMEMDISKPENLFADTENFTEVDMTLKYTVLSLGNEVDVYAIGLKEDAHPPYIAFPKKYRPLFIEGFTIKTKYNDEELLKYKVLVVTEFGEVIAMPMNLNEEYIYR